MGAVCLVCGRRPGSAPGSAVTFFRVAERKSPKKGRPPVCDPFALRRGNLRRGGCGCAVELALRWRAPLGQPRRVSSRGMRASTRMLTPQPPRRRRSQQGWDSRTSEHPHGPLLRSAQFAQREALAPARSGPSAAQRSNGPCGCPHPGFPSGCAEERSGRGGLCAEGHTGFVI